MSECKLCGQDKETTCVKMAVMAMMLTILLMIKGVSANDDSKENDVTSGHDSKHYWDGYMKVAGIGCTPLIAPENGIFACTEGTVHLSKCYFMCKDGYHIPEGQHELLKCIKRDWSHPPPQCVLNGEMNETEDEELDLQLSNEDF